MERKIGEIFEYNGEWYQCIVGCYCIDCAFNPSGKCDKYICIPDERRDGKRIIFKKLEKVGEPYSDYCPSGRVIYFQRYKCYQKPIDTGNFIYWADDINISIEIKQNKEDMEENNNAKHSNTENIRKNLREFDLEAARSGKPVCTRDGRKAIFLTTLSNKNFPVVAIVSCGQEENVYQYDINGVCDEHDDNLDLMMLPEKKEGWVNVYYNQSQDLYYFSAVCETKEEALEHCLSGYVDTIKVEWEG